MRKFGKNYDCKISKEKVKFFIDGKDGSECRGQSFYKYYALNKYSVEALTHLYIYATHPCQLNDPLDCADKLIEFDDIESARKLSGDIFSEIADSYDNDEKSILEFEKEAYRTYLYMKLGIFSLAESWNDISMWSAYTEHKGFCLEFDVFSFPFDFWGPFQVNYQEELKRESLKELTLPIATLIQTNVKLKCWEHEKEWRLLLQGPEDYYMEPFGERAAQVKLDIPDYRDRKLRYPMHCLKSICLGMKFFNGAHVVISDYEDEIVASNKLQNEVLSFLATAQIPTYVMDNMGLKIGKRPIRIIKIRKNAYRITYR